MLHKVIAKITRIIHKIPYVLQGLLHLTRIWGSVFRNAHILNHISQVDANKCPEISILIYICESSLHTYNCLAAIKNGFYEDISLEIILIDDTFDDIEPKLLVLFDDAIADEVQAFLGHLSNVRIIRNKERSGRIQSFNAVAKEAKGRFLHFLDEGDRVAINWLKYLREVAEENPNIGIVGSKLFGNSACLQSAGGVIWRDGTLWEYGLQNAPDEPEYNYIREVDYCSARGGLVKAEVFDLIGGFVNIYVSDAYADADFCFMANQLGYKAIYQPKSQVILYCQTVGLNTTIARDNLDQNIVDVSNSVIGDRERFAEKWHVELQKHLAKVETNFEFAPRRLLSKLTILVADLFVPDYDRSSGAYRLFNIIKILRDLNYHVIFLPGFGHDQDSQTSPYTAELESMGVEVLYFTKSQRSDWRKRLERRLPVIDFAWICRPELCETYLPILQQRAEIKIIFDTVDLHFLRLKRQWELSSDRSEAAAKKWQDMQTLEIGLARQVNATAVVTEVEKDILENLHIANLWVIPNVHQIGPQAIQDFSDRRDLLFIGNYYHEPNVDAVIWLCREIMPLIWATHPEIRVTLLGSSPVASVQALTSDRVLVPGYIKNVEPYFLSHRVFVAPLRYGAGMKGKIGQSLSYGLPTVTTSIGAEGMGLTSGSDVMIADDPETFARSILALYEDVSLWQTISAGSLKALQPFTPESVKVRLEKMLEFLGESHDNFKS